MARPRKVIDPEMVRQLAMIQCSLDEMAAVLKCERTTLHRRFATVIEKGREEGKSSLKRSQYKLAMAGNATMLIWLGKQHLGQTDKSTVDMSLNGAIDHYHKHTTEELDRLEASILGQALPRFAPSEN